LSFRAADWLILPAQIATKLPERMSKPAHAETKDAIIDWHRHSAAEGEND
jgi:hypothetical protein